MRRDPAQPVIDALAKESAAKLEAMRKDIEAQITDLRTQLRCVDRALVKKDADGHQELPR